MIKQLFTQFAEKTINTVLTLDPASYQRLQPHAGKVLQITLTDFNQDLYLIVREDQLYLFSQYTDTPDTLIRGSVFSFLEQLTTDVIPKSLLIEGDIEFAQAVQTSLRELNLHWEDYLSYVCGDVTAHYLSTLWQQLKTSGLKTTQRTLEDTVAYIQEEKRFLPSREEVEDFYEDISMLRQDIDRLEARWHRLKEKSE